MNWLVAEDDLDIRNLIVLLAEMWGHSVVALENGQRVLEWMEVVEAGSYEGPLPDLVILDIRMPGCRGDQIAERMRSSRLMKDLPIVLMTAFVMSDSEQAEVMARTGVDGVINKPLPDFSELQTSLDNIIEQRRIE